MTLEWIRTILKRKFASSLCLKNDAFYLPISRSQYTILCLHIGQNVFIGSLLPILLRQVSQNICLHETTLYGSNSKSKQTGQINEESRLSNSGSASKIFCGKIVWYLIHKVNNQLSLFKNVNKQLPFSKMSTISCHLSKMSTISCHFAKNLHKGHFVINLLLDGRPGPWAEGIIIAIS